MSVGITCYNSAVNIYSPRLRRALSPVKSDGCATLVFLVMLWLPCGYLLSGWGSAPYWSIERSCRRWGAEPPERSCRRWGAEPPERSCRRWGAEPPERSYRRWGADTPLRLTYT